MTDEQIKKQAMQVLVDCIKYGQNYRKFADKTFYVTPIGNTEYPSLQVSCFAEGQPNDPLWIVDIYPTESFGVAINTTE